MLIRLSLLVAAAPMMLPAATVHYADPIGATAFSCPAWDWFGPEQTVAVAPDPALFVTSNPSPAIGSLQPFTAEPAFLAAAAGSGIEIGTGRRRPPEWLPFEPQPVPEPATAGACLIAAGCCAVVVGTRRARRRSS